jgi:hypothetical protein
MTIQRAIRPGVQIQQQFLTTDPTLSDPQMPTVIVGPNYQPVTGALAGDYAGSSVALAYPGIETGAIVKAASVVAKLSSILLNIWVGGSQTLTVASDHVSITVTGGNPDFSTKTVAVGDLLTATVGGVSVTAKVIAVVSATNLQLDRDLPFSSAASFVITRAAVDTVLPSNTLTVDADTVTVHAAVAIGGIPVYSAKVSLDYLALRQSSAYRLTTSRLAADVVANLGAAILANPLALGTLKAKANTVTSILSMAIGEDSALGYLTALGFLENEGVYTIVFTTQDPAIQSLLKTHVQQMSAAAISKFRICFINLPNPTEELVQDPLTQGSLKRASNVLTLSQPTATFVTDGVLVGDIVKTTARTGTNPTVDTSHVGTYKVLAIKNQSTLVLENNFYTGANGVYTVGTAISADFTVDYYDFTVTRVLDKAGQAMAIAKTANSYAERRVTYITNESVVVTIDSVKTTVPGWVMACAYGGMNAGTPPQQGYTGLGIVGIDEVRFGSRYFKDDDLRLIAGSGGFVVTQDTPTALPSVYLQTTTDNATVLRRELSVTRCIDYYSFALRDVVAKYTGRTNIVPKTLVRYRNDVETVHTRLKGQELPDIGAPITDASIVGLQRDASSSDTVRLITKITVPVPLNNSVVTVEVAS